MEQDREVLQQIIERIGESSPALKEATAWVGEKASELKLRIGAGGALGILQGLEMLALGIQGKLALWRALQKIASSDARLRGFNFDQLAARAQQQHARVEERRLEAAVDAFEAGLTPPTQDAPAPRR